MRKIHIWLIKYEGENNLANLSIEESYTTERNNNFNGTSNRLYSFRDIKITPVDAHRIFSPTTSNEYVTADTSTGVTDVTIPQLYNIVKSYEKNEFAQKLSNVTIKEKQINCSR